MSKFNINEVYEDRLKQIDIDIKAAIRKKHWSLKKILESEKDRILKCLPTKEE